MKRALRGVVAVLAVAVAWSAGPQAVAKPKETAYQKQVRRANEKMAKEYERLRKDAEKRQRQAVRGSRTRNPADSTRLVRSPNVNSGFRPADRIYVTPPQWYRDQQKAQREAAKAAAKRAEDQRKAALKRQNDARKLAEKQAKDAAALARRNWRNNLPNLQPTPWINQVTDRPNPGFRRRATRLRNMGWINRIANGLRNASRGSSGGFRSTSPSSGFSNWKPSITTTAPAFRQSNRPIWSGSRPLNSFSRPNFDGRRR